MCGVAASLAGRGADLVEGPEGGGQLGLVLVAEALHAGAPVQAVPDGLIGLHEHV